MSSINHFFIPPAAFSEALITLPEPVARQIAQVLRLQSGDKVILLDGLGKALAARLMTVEKNRVTARPEAEAELPAELPVPLHLIVAMTQRDKFEFILQKATEMGVSSIMPVITQRSLVQRVGQDGGKSQRRQQIIQEAAEQSHRLRLPLLYDPQPFGQALARATGPGLCLLCHESAGMPMAPLVSAARHACGEGILLAIGPEGGFSDEEATQAVASGFHAVSLGKRVLRMETAVIAALAIAGNSLEFAN